MTVRRSIALVVILLAATPAAAQGLRKGGEARGAPAQPDSGAPPPKQEKSFPLGASWLAVTLNGKPFGPDKPAFTLDTSLRAKGFGGCNTFSATAYPLRQQGFAVGPFALTKKSCTKEVMDAERAFLVALRAAKTWDVEAGQLVIKGGAGELRFERSL